MTPGAKHCPARETVGEPKAVCGLNIFRLHFTTGNRKQERINCSQIAQIIRV